MGLNIFVGKGFFSHEISVEASLYYNHLAALIASVQVRVV